MLSVGITPPLVAVKATAKDEDAKDVVYKEEEYASTEVLTVFFSTSLFDRPEKAGLCVASSAEKRNAENV